MRHFCRGDRSGIDLAQTSRPARSPLRQINARRATKPSIGPAGSALKDMNVFGCSSGWAAFAETAPMTYRPRFSPFGRIMSCGHCGHDAAGLPVIAAVGNVRQPLAKDFPSIFSGFSDGQRMSAESILAGGRRRNGELREGRHWLRFSRSEYTEPWRRKPLGESHSPRARSGQRPSTTWLLRPSWRK